MIPKGMKKFSFFSEQGLQAIIPSANGVFTAESLAKIYAMLASHGEWQGQQLISQEVFQRLESGAIQNKRSGYAFTDALALGLSTVFSL